MNHCNRSFFFLFWTVFFFAPPALGIDPCEFRKLDEAKTGHRVAPIEGQLGQEAVDAVTLARINAIKDPKERAKAKQEYYPESVKGWQKLWGVAGLGASGLLAAEVVRRFVEHPNIFTAGAAVAVMVPALFASDYANSEFHWGLDNTFYNAKKGVTFLSRLFTGFFLSQARDARTHHEDPQACLKSDYLSRVAQLGAAAAPALLATTALFDSGLAGKLAETGLAPLGVHGVGPLVDTALASFLGTFFFTGMHGTISHQMAHHPSPPWYWRALQKLRIAVRPADHMRHHKPPYDDVYSTQSGLVDLFRGRAYWQKRLRRYYDTTGEMPGTWIQDPRAIPADIAAKLKADYEKNSKLIPLELWAYAPKAYPKRVPDDLKEPLRFVQEKWRVDFIIKRQREYQWMAKTDLKDAEEKWAQEQKDYPWIYGPAPQPLDLEL